MAKKKLTKLQENFVDEYFVDFNITNAYIRAGYSVENCKRSSIHRMAYAVFKNELVQKEIKARLEDYKQDRDVIYQKLVQKAMEIIDNPDSKPSDVLKAMQYLGDLFSLTAQQLNVTSNDLSFNIEVLPAKEE